MFIVSRISSLRYTHVEGSSKSHRNLNTDTTDVTDFHGLGPLTGSAIRATYSGVFRIRVHPFNPWHPCSNLIGILLKTPQKLPARTNPTTPSCLWRDVSQSNIGKLIEGFLRVPLSILL